MSSSACHAHGLEERMRVAPVFSSTAAAVHAAWANWGIPRQLGKTVIKQDDIDVLGARVSGTLDRISLPRTVVSQLIAFVVVVLPR